MRIALKCLVCGYTRVLADEETYTQEDLVCPSENHAETELIRVEEPDEFDEPPTGPPGPPRV